MQVTSVAEIALVTNSHPLQVNSGIGFLCTLEGFSFVTSLLKQLDLRDGVVFAGCHVDRVPTESTCGGNRIDQALGGGDIQPL